MSAYFMNLYNKHKPFYINDDNLLNMIGQCHLLVTCFIGMLQHLNSSGDVVEEDEEFIGVLMTVSYNH